MEPAFISRYRALFETTPADDMPVDQVRFVVLDSETTGLDPRHDRLITMGAVAVRSQLRNLEAAGYVERTVDARDARRAGLTLTAAGRSVNRRRAGTFEDAVRRERAGIPFRITEIEREEIA